MTVTYTLEVSGAKLCGFPKLLVRWKGSIYRLMYQEMLCFLGAYYFILCVYRYGLNSIMKQYFESLAVYCREFTSVIPITFVMGFYVAMVVGRWWQQYMSIPWPDRLSIQVSAYVHGTDERGRLIRRSMARYLNLMTVFTFQNTSTVIKRRFPTMGHLVDAGILTPEEKIHLDSIQTPHGLWWVPAQWFCELAIIARKESRIHDDVHLKSLIDECSDFRGLCGMVWSYDWISVPLVYTQVVTIAVYSFFVACLFGRQYLQFTDSDLLSKEHSIDFYLPVFTIFQFFFYVGWLKVAESMICPFGEDDDDFDLNWIIDRNIQVSLLIVDEMHNKTPPLTKDIFWGSNEANVPYTQSTAKFKSEPFFGSTSAMNIGERQFEWETEQQLPPIQEERLPKRIRSSSEDEHDTESLASRRYEGKKKRGLGGLLLGFSRQTLTSRQGSRKSLNSITGGRSTNSNLPSSSYVSSPRISTFRRAAMERGGAMSLVDRQRSTFSYENADETSGLTESSPAIGISVAEAESNASMNRIEKLDIPPMVQEESETDSGNGEGDTVKKQKFVTKR